MILTFTEINEIETLYESDCVCSMDFWSLLLIDTSKSPSTAHLKIGYIENASLKELFATGK